MSRAIPLAFTGSFGVEVDSTTKLDIVSNDDVVRVCSVIELIRELELLCLRPDLDRGLFGLGTDIVLAHTGEQSHPSSPSSDRNSPRVTVVNQQKQYTTNAITPDCSQMDIKIIAIGTACPDHLPSFLKTTLPYPIRAPLLDEESPIEASTISSPKLYYIRTHALHLRVMSLKNKKNMPYTSLHCRDHTLLRDRLEDFSVGLMATIS